MFGKREEISQEIDTLIGENAKITGKVEGTGNIRIDGNIKGDIEYTGDIVISETGKVNGNIECCNLSTSGTVEGNIKLNGKLTILATGKLIGDAEVENLIVHDNGFFHGNCKMIKEKIQEEELEEA